MLLTSALANIPEMQLSYHLHDSDDSVVCFVGWDQSVE